MSRSTLLVLRVLAIGGAVTVLACHVVNKQQQANAGAAGERGSPGTAPNDETRISSTKSVVVKLPPAIKLAPSHSQSASHPPSHDVRILGTKSAAVVSPLDAQNVLPDPLEGQRFQPNPPPPVVPAPPPPRFHGTKSGRMVAPEEVRQMQQRAAPAQQSAPAQP